MTSLGTRRPKYVLDVKDIRALARGSHVGSRGREWRGVESPGATRGVSKQQISSGILLVPRSAVEAFYLARLIFCWDREIVRAVGVRSAVGDRQPGLMMAVARGRV